MLFAGVRSSVLFMPFRGIKWQQKGGDRMMKQMTGQDATETLEVEVTAGEENLLRVLEEALRELDAPPTA